MIPDHGVVRKIKDYDPSLYVIWDDKNQFFELWRKMENGIHKLITPITQSIYNNTSPREFIQLDERILWWLHESDSWKHGGSKRLSMEQDRRFKEFQLHMKSQRMSNLRDLVKDCYGAANNFYATKQSPKNGKPKFNNFQRQKMLAPDVRSNNSSRVFYRSSDNAKSYNFQVKK